MRVLIMADMEGVSGIVTWDQTTGGKSLYEEGRKLYTEEINAAVRGAKAAGATEIVAVDCHGAGGDWSFNSFVPELLHPDCEWVAHHPWSRYTDTFEDGCDALLLVGMHARNNTPDGVLCHTISTVKWHNLWFNDDLVGESAINAALAGHYNCPVALVTGDTATIRECRETMGDEFVGVAVKKGLTRYSARQIPPVRAREMIEAGAKEALKNLSKMKPYIPAKPTTLKVEVGNVEKLAEFMGRPNVEIDTPNLMVYSRGDNWMQVWDQVWHW